MLLVGTKLENLTVLTYQLIAIGICSLTFTDKTGN